MLERYFVRPATVDRIRASWMGYPSSSTSRRWPTRATRLATSFAESPCWCSSESSRMSVVRCVSKIFRPTSTRSSSTGPGSTGPRAPRERRGGRSRARCAIQSSRCSGSSSPDSRAGGAPGGPALRSKGRAGGFFHYLTAERGLRQASVHHYHHHLGPFEAYLERVGCRDLAALSPPVLGAFVAESASHLCADERTRSMRSPPCFPALPPPRAPDCEGSERLRREVAHVPPIGRAPFDPVGRRATHARCRRSPHRRWQARLRDPRAPRDVRPPRT